jgi:hypothetical protein
MSLCELLVLRAFVVSSEGALRGPASPWQGLGVTGLLRHQGGPRQQ